MEKKQSHIPEKYSIIGAGASGLFLALFLLRRGKIVDLYEKTGGVLKKFLIAGKGGLNLTHSESLEQFKKRYNKNQNLFDKLLKDFSPDDLRNELKGLGVETFIGSSGRVFPKELQAGDIQRLWLSECQKFESFHLYLKHQLINFKKPTEGSGGFTLINEFGEEKNIGKENIILALGGGSYRATGSDGSWMEILKTMNVETVPLKPINCGYNIDWSEEFKSKADYKPLKNIVLKVGEMSLRGEALLTEYGIEGSLIYAMSGFINSEIEKKGKAIVELDLKPDYELGQIKEILESPRVKESYSNFLRKKLKLNPLIQSLLKEFSTKEEFQNPQFLSKIIKGLEIHLSQARPIDEAISTSGGISFNEVDENLMLKKYPGVYVMGEMLDWDAPTGGYLLQGCFSMAHYLSRKMP